MLGWQCVNYWKPKSLIRDHVSTFFSEVLQGTLFLLQGTLYTHPCSWEIYLLVLSSFSPVLIASYLRVISFSWHISNFSLFVSVPSIQRRNQEIKDIEKYHESTIIDYQVSMLLFCIDQCIHNVSDYSLLHTDLPSRALFAHLCRVYGS